MEIIKDKVNNIPVTYIKTNKFNTVSAKLVFKTKVEKELITKRIMLRNMMLTSCKKYNTNKKVNLACLENYDENFFGRLEVLGNYIINSFSFSCITDKFVNDNVIDKTVDDFCEIVFNPNVKNGEFDKETFDVCYKKMEQAINSEKEKPDSYCFKNLYKLLGKNKPYSYDWNLEDLKKINPENLYNEYNNMINNSDVSLYIIGDLDYKKVAENILKNINSTKKIEEGIYIENDYKDNIVEKEESISLSASVIAYGFKCKDLTNFEKSYVLPLYCNILGGGASSRCFDNIRENNSLAYYCNTFYRKPEGLLVIYAGIQKENYEKTKNLMIDIQESMNKIEDEELEIAKKDYISFLNGIQDYRSRIIDAIYNVDLLNDDNLDEKIKNFCKVTKKDIEKVHGKIIKDSIFFLRGEK